MKKSWNKELNEKILSPWRWKLITKKLVPYLGDSKKVLDLGAGDGGLAGELLRKLPLEIKGVDVYQQEKTFIPIRKYDGKTLPFADYTFDTVMINDVLHHDLDPAEVLKEARRVTKKYVLIKDHYWTNKLDYWLLKWTDYLGNMSYGVKMPFNFLTKRQWQKLFVTCRLKKIKEEYFRYYPIDPSQHVIYLLEKTEL